MRTLRRPTGTASPASGALRGLRAGALAALCVLLPLAGHVLSLRHAPRWIILAAVAAVAVPGAALLTRRRLTDAEVVGTLVAAQITAHAAAALPGACRAMTGGGALPSGPGAFAEHGGAAGPPVGVVLGGHLVSVLLAARLLGVGERLLWQSRPLLAAVGRLLLLVRPPRGRAHGTAPAPAARRTTTAPRPDRPVRLHAGRSPPRRTRLPLAPFRPMPIGGPPLP
ncbi:hypothetical protein SZN_26476 [Streptomyces zinciresistens K42]|uniref:Uncharacterized protein n=1 Tax=Streptomyces zinciresistens K42 TaxID=700597 RepID=G2GIF5_9ACTN|nr:hypothetical protein [Streptomyces zinciresistens]EGX56721.1 hypothetical protein SZN_26476 [Streptomyces zinciresistens K42]